MFNLTDTDPIEGSIEALFDSAWDGFDDTAEHIYDVNWSKSLKHVCLVELDLLEAMFHKYEGDAPLMKYAVDRLETMVSRLPSKDLEPNIKAAQSRDCRTGRALIDCTRRALMDSESEATCSDCSTTYHDISSDSSDGDEVPENSDGGHEPEEEPLFELPRVLHCSPSGTESVLFHVDQRVPASSKGSAHSQADGIGVPTTLKGETLESRTSFEETYANWWLWSSGGGLEDELCATTLPTLSRVKSVAQL
jgi:hypothetical protein